MKKLATVVVLICMFVCLISCSKQGVETPGLTESTTQLPVAEEGQSQSESVTEEKTEAQQAVIKGKEKIIIDDGTYQFEINKTNFEDEIPEDILLQFANMLLMDFGVEDYYGWNTSGQNVFSDVRKSNLVISGCYKNYDFLDEETDKEAYAMFLSDVGLEYNMYCEVNTFSLKKYNDYLKDFFGPDVKQLTVDDFETGKSALKKGFAVDGDIGESDTRCFYTGKDDVILIHTCATGFSCVGEYIFDVKKDGDDYYVYTVGEVETHGLIDNFDEFQNQALDDLIYSIYKGVLPAKKYKFGCTADGDIYLKSVDKKFIFPENPEYNCVIEQKAEIKNKKADSEKLTVTGTIPKGVEIVRLPQYESYELDGMYFVACEDYCGYVDSTYIKETDS
ncbi:MAG: hypothetical protein E7516_00390 [Ruminococcaceae bacterium]|nr:hypothetical protein [Oscillospiraceae bacterium]